MELQNAIMPKPGKNAPTRVTVVDGLRGIASLAVAWYHLVFSNHAFAGGGFVAAALRESGRNAWTGVEVFFVISGFVIPLALHRSHYTPRSYGRFLVKRITRLDPPYLVSVVLCVALWYLWAVIPGLHGPPFTLTLGPLLLHLGYLNAFFGQGWLNPVYWTLAIEFQYYLGMGLLAGALISKSPFIRLLTFAGLGLLAVSFPSPSLVFHYLFVFMLGMATFQYFVGLLTRRLFLMVLGVLTIGCGLTIDPLVAVVSLAAALAIAFVRLDIPLLGFLGTISYSLYLVHVPIGERILELGLAHVQGGVLRVLVLGLSLGLTLAAAAVLYLVAERPAQRWSSRIRYRPEPVGLELSELEKHPSAGLSQPTGS